MVEAIMAQISQPRPTLKILDDAVQEITSLINSDMLIRFKPVLIKQLTGGR